MKADLTRNTFNKIKHYNSVLQQQGRVQLDADWNEQLDINHHRIKVETKDIIGKCGGPINNAGFAITPSGKDLLIGKGRYYVNGILCENEDVVSVLTQPDIPVKNENNFLITLNDKSIKPFPPPAGSYLVYLDVWYRHITALEDPEIREVALGGPDTATREKTIWQVKLLQLNDQNVNINCLSDVQTWNDIVLQPDGKLSARAEADEQSNDPCIIAPGAGYRRLENQLYRVEVHKSGQRGTATFKWSRDNGSIVVKWLGQDVDNLTVSSLGRDKYLGFSSGQWIELFDDSNDLYNKPGLLVKIIKAADNVITIDPLGQTIDINNFPDNPRIRRWDSDGDLLIETPSDNNGWLKIEDGVEIKFSGGDFHSGDYWLIPARTATADVEWQKDASDNPVLEVPKGIKHSFCRIAIADFDGSVWNIISDCRNLFPPVTELLNLFYVSGDGQEVMPDVSNPQQLVPLPQLIKVGVSNGEFPVPNASIKFEIKTGNGNVNGTNEIVVLTDDKGIASCQWSLDSQTLSQQVEADLLNANSDPIHLPVVFTANLSLATNVSYDPQKCSNLKNAKTVQEAIDILCQLSGGRDPGIHVKDLRLISGNELQNDTDVSVQEFIRGIEIVCDEVIEQDTVRGRPTCFVTLDLPYPLNDADRNAWDIFNVFGFQSLRIDAETNSDNNSIFWKPSADAIFWLQQRLFKILQLRKLGDRVLAHLTLMGNFIWGVKDPNIYLDGELYGIRKEGNSSPTLLKFPSGNGIKGGNLEMWFYLVPSEVDIKPLQVTAVNFITLINGVERQSSAGKVNPPVDPGKVRFKAGENVNVIEIDFSRPVGREGLGPINTPQSIRLDLTDDAGAPHKMFGDIQIINLQKVRFLLKDPVAINKPGEYRLTILGNDSDSVAIRTQDDKTQLDGDYNNQPGEDFLLVFRAL